MLGTNESIAEIPIKGRSIVAIIENLFTATPKEMSVATEKRPAKLIPAESIEPK